MKNLFFLILLCLFYSCGEKLIEKPTNLIPKDTMAAIIHDLAVISAAKNSNSEILKKNNIETMDYIYTKYGVDSIQFVNSDIYYASIPAEYEEIYTAVDTKLQIEKKQMEEDRRQVLDSAGNRHSKSVEKLKKRKSNEQIKDSLQ